jgi:purine-nucleoside phosphorylase
MNAPYKLRVEQSADFLKDWDPHPPELCIVLGSGLGQAIPNIETMRSLKFSEIPGFAASEVIGHASELRVGECPIEETQSTRKIAFLRGRNHAYEGFSTGDVAHNVRAMIAWGVRGIILTNAAGCLETSWKLGDFMLIEDHINMSGLNPLAGIAGNGFGQRFCDMTQCYDKNWASAFRVTAAAAGINLRQGIYAGVLGPSYETPAEIRMLRTLGAHAVGMSTVIEAIAARQMGAKVAGLSCLTNYGAGLTGPETRLSHSEVVQMGSSVAKIMAELVLKTATRLSVGES